MAAVSLEAGSPAPDFTLPDKDGKAHSLSDYRGQKVIVYFYPAASTPGAPPRPVTSATTWRHCRELAMWCWVSRRTNFLLFKSLRRMRTWVSPAER
jgi:peroxiredoxin